MRLGPSVVAIVERALSEKLLQLHPLYFLMCCLAFEIICISRLDNHARDAHDQFE